MPEITHEFTVDEGRWYRGKCGSRLVREEDGLMCCMGFYGESVGVPVEAMRGRSMPDSHGLETYREEFGSLLAIDAESKNHVAFSIAITNDYGGHTDDERKARLTELFASIGVRVKFEKGGAA